MSLAGCLGNETDDNTDIPDGSDGTQDKIEYMTKEEVAALLTNYHFEIEIFTVDGDEENLYKMTEVVCAEGYYYYFDTYAFVANFETNKYYILDIEAKTGMITALEEEDKESFNVSTYMFSWHTYASGFHHSGTQSVAGRTCDVYTYNTVYHSQDFVFTYYIDKELDICLKYEWTDKSENVSSYMRFTKFELNKASLEGIMDTLDEYELTDLTSF